MKINYCLFLLLLVQSTLSFSQVVINEVHVRPSGGDTDQAFQSMYNVTPTSGSEYIEIYNTNPCQAIDISCWSIGGMDGGTNGGSFSFPSGTSIAPLGFITLGGPNTVGVTFNLNLASNAALLWRSNANRWHLPNGDGWLSLYDATGLSVDAVYWTFAPNDPTKLNTDATFTDGVLQRIVSCGGGSLATASSIPGIEYITMASATGLSFERSTDGASSWALGAATPNDCNGVCATNSAFSLNAVVQQPSCGAADGSISFNPNPSGAYTYLWSPNVSTINSATGLSVGTYDITITLNGCSIDTTIILTSLSGVSDVDVVETDADCGQTNGSVSLTNFFGGTGPYLVNFNGQGFTANTDYLNLGAGSYSIVVQDAAGCQFNAPNAEILNGSGPNAVQVTATATTCGLDNGVLEIESVNGGLASYQYNIGGQGLNAATVFSDLAAGSYSVVVVDANGCSYFAPDVTINPSSNPTGIIVNTSNPTCGDNNGSITLGAVTGGTAPYQYNFNGQGFSSSTSFTGLFAGSYTLTLQDVNGCLYTAPNVVLAPSNGPTEMNVTVIDATCNEQNGEITILSTIGGIQPYQYSLNGSAFSPLTNYAGLSAGNYSVVVQDAAGCTFTLNQVIGGGNGPIANFSMTPSSLPIYNPILQLINESSADVISYQWVVPNGSPATATTENLQTSFDNSAVGFYPITLIVTNAQGCVDSITKMIELYDDIIIYAPNAFTPDGDEHNNGWGVIISGADLTTFKLEIYNRWGEIIFESYDVAASWDGTYHGKLVQDGIFTWTVSMKDSRNDNKYEYQGHLTVIR